MKSESLADQKMETVKGRDTLIKRQRPKLRFLKLVSLADQKAGDTLRQRHPDQKADTQT